MTAMQNGSKKFLSSILLLIIVTVIANSHPHVFIDTKVQIAFKDSGLIGFKVEWLFDDMFSSTIIMDYDRNGNGVFEHGEIDAVQKEAFSNLRNFNYFILLVSNKEEVDIDAVKDFQAEIIQGKVQYSFFVPFKIDAGPRSREIKIGVFDDTYFCDIAYAENSPVIIDNRGAISSSYRLIKDAGNAYWGDQIIPQVILLQFRKK